MSVLKESLLNLFRKPFTEKYPFAKKETSERFRGRILYDSKACIGCKQCVNNCPVRAITFHKKGKIDFNMGKCVLCGLCRDVCPVKCIHYTHEYEYASADRKKLEKNLVE